MNIELSLPTKIGIALLLIALIGFLFGSTTVGGFSLGLGGLILVYSGFRLFWKKLESKYTE